MNGIIYYQLKEIMVVCDPHRVIQHAMITPHYFTTRLIYSIGDFDKTSKEFSEHALKLFSRGDFSFSTAHVCINPELIKQITKIIDAAEIWVSHLNIEDVRQHLLNEFCVNLLPNVHTEKKKMLIDGNDVAIGPYNG